MKIDLAAMSTAEIAHLISAASAELATRLSAPQVERVAVERPVEILRAPSAEDRDFVLAIKTLFVGGGYINAEDRRRVAAVAAEFGPWVVRQGLPTTHNAGDWLRAGRRASIARAKER